MNFDKLYARALGVVIAAAVVGQLDNLQAWIWRAQARVLYESRTAKWGSPRFFQGEKHIPNHLKKNKPILDETRISRGIVQKIGFPRVTGGG
jgi:hypothetical protein